MVGAVADVAAVWAPGAATGGCIGAGGATVGGAGVCAASTPGVCPIGNVGGGAARAPPPPCVVALHCSKAYMAFFSSLKVPLRSPLIAYQLL